MALPLAKLGLGLIVGAGLVGPVFLKEGQASNVTDLLSGAFKVVFKQLSKGEPDVKPRNDILMEQVNNLRQELLNLNAMVVVTGSSSGSSKYGIVVIIVAGCSGYVWWKGWKFPGMMFATKRGLSEACDTVAKQLEDLYSSLRLSRRELSSKIESVGCQMKEVTELTVDTDRKVNEINQEVSEASKSIMFVHETVHSLRTKIERIEGKQGATIEGVEQLVGVANDMKNKRASARVHALPPSPSGQALQRRQLVSTLQHTRSVPPPEPCALCNSDEIQQVPATALTTRRQVNTQALLQSTVNLTSLYLQDLNVNSEDALGAGGYADSLSESRLQEVPANGEPSSSSKFGKLFSGFGSIIGTRSATVTRPVAVKQTGIGGVLR